MAGTPFCRIADMVGTRLVVLPFSDFCDPIAASEQLWRALSDKLLEEGAPVMVRCLHNALPLADPRFVVSKQAAWHCLDLRASLDALWLQLDPPLRRAIKKAQREGVTVQVAQEETALRAFFALHVRVRKHKYRLLAQPYHFFENIWRQFIASRRGVLLTALYQGEIISSAVFLEWQDTFYYKFSASSLSHLPLRANELLLWEAIRHGKEHGCAFLDFGLSDLDQTGLIGFKRKFAPEEKTISFLRHTPCDGRSPQEQQARDLLPTLTELFTQETVPDHITSKAGEVLYRFFA
jgi:hypothetical protein